jgi:hypothetical protein
LIVTLLGEGVRLEPVKRRGERDTRFPSRARSQHAKCRVLGQSLRVVGVLVPGQAAVDRLTKQVAQRELGVASGARIAELSLDQRTHAEALVQLAREKQSSIGGNARSAELDTKLGIEREANRARFRVTHWMMPSAPTGHPEGWYNSRRRHSVLDYLSPMAYEKRALVQV